MSGTAKANERQVAIGGLMRCCLQSIADSEAETEIGSTLTCKWCENGAMRVMGDGVWHWDHPEDDECSYCGESGWIWVNGVECTHCDAGRELAKRGNLPDAPLDPSVAAVEVPDGE